MSQAREITICRCMLRVMRRGGWSWGVDAQALVRRAIERLPALLERRLTAFGDSLPDEIEIVQPLFVRVPMRSQEWMELTGSTELSAQTRTRLEVAIDAAITQALPATLATLATVLRAAESSYTISSAAPDADAHGASPSVDAAVTSRPSALWKLLSQWRAEEKLLTQLPSLDEVVLQLWLERLIELEVSTRHAVLDEASLAELWREVCALPLLMPAGFARTLVRQLIFTLELKMRWAPGSALARTLLASFCDDYAPTAIDVPPKSAYSATAPADTNALAVQPEPITAASAAIVAQTAPHVDSTFEVDIPCALPFLMLTPLSRAGYFTTLAAALEAANATSLAGGVALGLSHKCLAPPQRGWLRDPDALAAAAAVAGRRSCDNELILNAGRGLRPQLALLDGCLVDQLFCAHRAEAGWLLARSASGALVLFDEDGPVPVATGSLASLAMRIAPSAGVLFLSAHAAGAEHLDTLDELQIPYASDANLASRKSAASFIAPDGRRFWVSLHGAQQGRARALAERGATLTEAALANWSAVHDARGAQRPRDRCRLRDQPVAGGLFCPERHRLDIVAASGACHRAGRHRNLCRSGRTRAGHAGTRACHLAHGPPRLGLARSRLAGRRFRCTLARRARGEFWSGMKCQSFPNSRSATSRCAYGRCHAYCSARSNGRLSLPTSYYGPT
ncbi:hypothetical protein [Paraburkholderia terrae]